jgi:hypothetical protein
VNRAEFEHVVRAAADVVDDDIVVIGSQAILSQHPDPPAELLRSAELGVFPRVKLDAADQIDGAIGDGSTFHETFGYFARRVGPETLTAPAGWEQRLIRIELPAVQRKRGTVVAWCIEKHDLALAKLAAGRPRDIDYVADALAAGLVDMDQLELGVDLMPKSHRDVVRDRLGALRF